MFELNPLSQPDAWWQHILMVVVASLLGYIIGYRSGKFKVMELEKGLLYLDKHLLKCLSEKEDKSSQQRLITDTQPSDNLKMIEGIGPKIEQLLKSIGINSFYDLSQTKVEEIADILKNAGSRYQMHDPSTWPRQAELAVRGEWERLKEWQDELDKGREIN